MEQQKLKDKVCLITASSTGIGLAIAKKYAQNGAKVVINSRNQKNIDSAIKELAAEGIKVDGMQCHTGKKSDREKLIKYLVDKYGGIDVLVCNAAVSTHFGDLLDITEDQMDKMYQINIKSSFQLIQECKPFMRNQEADSDANIIILSSYAAYQPDLSIGFYSITKTTLVAMTKVFAKYFLHEKIRVNCIAPGVIKTKFSEGLWKNREQETVNLLNVTRLGVPEDIANVALFLGSKDASYITGECIAAAGLPIPRL